MKTHFLIFLLLSSIFFSCEDSEENPDGNQTQPETYVFEKTGLDGRIINELQRQDNKWFALTDNGLYENNNTISSSWNSLKLEGKEIIGFTILDDGTYLAVWNNPQGETPASGISTSGNQGDTWQMLENNFGGQNAERFSSFYALNNDSDVLYAGGLGVLARSLDQGKNWEPIWGDWDMLANGTDEIAINPNDTDEIWFGGQGSIENGYLIKKIGDDIIRWDDLVENPTVVKKILFDPTDADRILVGFEGALLGTQNSGNSWQTLIDSPENRFFFGLASPSQNSDLIYAGGWLKRFDDPQTLVVYVSEDGGDSWENIKHDTEDFGGITSMKLVEGESQDVLYLGLYKGGVYKLTINK